VQKRVDGIRVTTLSGKTLLIEFDSESPSSPASQKGSPSSAASKEASAASKKASSSSASKASVTPFDAEAERALAKSLNEMAV